MNRFDIINRIGDKYRVGNTETGEFSYAQALKTVGKDIKDYQKATTGTQHKFLDIRFENERLVVLVECKNKFSRWDKAKIQGQLQDYVRFEKAYSDKKIVAILAETDGDEVWVWFGQSVIIDDEHRMEEETVLRTFEEYENLCFGRVNDKIKVVDSIKTLNEKLHSDGINSANKDVQKESDRILSDLVNKAVGFGYPNIEELQLGVTTELKIDDQIKNQTRLSYSAGTGGESLPSTHNGLGYKNLIKMEFLLAAFARDVEKKGEACIPLLFIEEPESHMHPQMQHAFAEHLENFLAKITTIHIQTFLTTHSAHIANTMDFSKIRYAQKSKSGVVYKNLDVFAKENADNMDFIKKYLTLSRCDLFFADKIIFVEGASERLMLPDMIEKCEKEKLFDSEKYKLPAQYYALIEIGGAYAYKFIPFADFLGLPCLILTDIDSMIDGRTKAVVSKGKTTSNATIKWWMRKIKGIPQNSKDMISLADINSATDAEKTLGKCHIEYQTLENGICGRSLEEAVMNVNRNHYGLVDPVAEEDLDFTEKSKTDFALNLICNNPNYSIPQYIKNGLIWLNKQRVLE